MALKLAVICQSQLSVFCLTFGIAFPCSGGALVATDMNALVGEQFYYLFQDSLGKRYSAIVGHIEHVVPNTTLIGLYLVRAFRSTAIFGIGCHGSGEVAGHVDFGNNVDVELLGVGHHVADFILRIEVRAVGLVLPIHRVAVHIRKTAVGSDASHLGQLGIFLDFDAPALVVAEVPVEAVHLVVGHHVEHTLDVLHGEEVARHVEHETAILKARLVLDSDQRQGISGDRRVGHIGHDIGRQHFLDALESVEQAEGIGCTDGNAASCDGQGVDTGLAAFHCRGLFHLEQGGSVAGNGLDTAARRMVVDGDELVHLFDHGRVEVG